MGFGPSTNVDSSSRSRNSQRTSGHIIPSSSELRPLSTVTVSSTKTISSTNTSDGGPICDFSKHPVSDVLYVDTGRQDVVHRRSVNVMGSSLRVCIPAVRTDSQGVEQDSSLVANDHFVDRAHVATSTVVSHSPQSLDRSPTGFASEDRSASNSRESIDESSETRAVQTDGLAAFRRRLENRGLSVEARDLIFQSWREGTRKRYGSELRRFMGWCDSRKIDPFSCPVSEVVNFLTELHLKGLGSSTVKNYRSAISAIHDSVDGHPIGQHPLIMRLVKGCWNARPPKPKLCPTWNVSAVLRLLQTRPFVPEKDIDLKHLTWKVATLLALTSGRRIDDIWKLSINPNLCQKRPDGYEFIPDDHLKQDRPDHYGVPIVIGKYFKNPWLDPVRFLDILK